MSDTTPTDGSHPRKSWFLSFVVLLALVPSAYLFVTGRQQRDEMRARTAVAESAAQALADSLDAARTQLLVDRILVLIQAGRMNQTSELASEFFDRVDRRSRIAGAPLSDTETRLRVLAMRDEAITALTRDDPAALHIIERIGSLHLPLGDPTVGARIPKMTVPEGLSAPGDTAWPDPNVAQNTDTLGSR